MQPTFPGPFDAVIFDMDGVVIDSETLHERAGRMAFARFNIAVPDSIFEDFKGKTDRNIVEHAVEQHARAAADVDEILELKRSNYADLIDELELIPGVMEFIQAVRRTYRIALTTSASRRNQHLAFNKFDLYPYFETIVTSDDISRPKPDPEPYLVTAEKLGLASENCLVIEDSTNGVLSGVAAGCTVAALTTSFDARSLHGAGGHVVVDTFAELARWLQLER